MQAQQVHGSLQQTAADCRVCYGRRHTQLQEVDKRLNVLTVSWLLQSVLVLVFRAEGFALQGSTVTQWLLSG